MGKAPYRILNGVENVYFFFRLRRWIGIAAGGLVLLLLINWLLPPLWPEPPAMNRLPVAGQGYFWAGVNYPWKTGQDFGTGAWGHMGVSNPTTYQEIDADFARLASQGVRVVKWRVFSDARYGLTFREDGYVTGLDDKFLADLDAALEIAAKHNIYLVFTLFASGLWTTDCFSGGVQMGGRAATLLDSDKRFALVQQGVEPMLRHLRGSDRVLAFEIIAEPEWGANELHREEDGRIKVPLAVIRDFVKQVTQAIHRDTRALATVESNRASNMRYWRGLGLDYYSFSWYDWLETYEPLATPARALGLDRPVVLGEFPIENGYYGLPQTLDLAYTLGYAGAFAWSFWSGDDFGDWQAAARSFTDWVAARSEDVSLGSLVPPSIDKPVAEIRYPYTYDNLDVQLEEKTVAVRLSMSAVSKEPYVARAYLYEVGSSRPKQAVYMAPSKIQPGKLTAHFTEMEDGKPYIVSLGIFNRDQVIQKWFHGITRLALVDGRITTPTLDSHLVEIICNP